MVLKKGSEMKIVRVALAVVSLVLVGASSHGAMSRTAPAAKSTAVARWWKQTVRIHYANGSWEWGYYRWWGHADSRTSPTVWILLNGSTQQAAWALIGARIEVVGLPYPG
jgi:hypothetical protein